MIARGSGTTNEEILEHIKHIFKEYFCIETSDINPDTKLSDDLEIDSLDAIA